MNQIIRDPKGRFLEGYPPTQFKEGHKPYTHSLTGSQKLCMECGIIFYTMPCETKRKFCSKFCYALNQSKKLKGKKIYLLTPKVRSKEWREKISKSLKGHPVSDKVRITSRLIRLTRPPKFINTSIELMVRRALIESGIKNFVCHKAIEEVTQPDIVFEKERLAIFCDGTYWHSLPKVKSRDAYINKILKTNLNECIKQIIVHVKRMNGGGRTNERRGCKKNKRRS